MLDRVIIGLNLSKLSNPDFLIMVALRNSEAEFSYILANFFSLNVEKYCLLGSLTYDACVKKYLGEH